MDEGRKGGKRGGVRRDEGMGRGEEEVEKMRMKSRENKSQ